MYQSPSEISNDFTKIAVQKATMSPVKQFVYGILGGAMISVGGLLAITVAGGMPEVAANNPGIVRFLFGAVFPVGLIMIVIGGAQLFTSDCAVIPYGVFTGRVTLKGLLRVWGIVYLANLIGALLVAYFFAYKAGVLTVDPYASFVKDLAITKTHAPFLKVFIKAIGANWLVCLAVWMSYAAKDVTGKILALWIPVMSFVALGLEHSIANMFFIPAAMFAGAEVTLGEFVIGNLLPATLGNILGGSLLVGAVYWYLFGNSNHQSPAKKESRDNHIIFKDFENRLN
jgi:formate transporter